MKTFEITKTRDGQGEKHLGSIYASSLEDAKKQFTDGIRNDLERDCNAIHIDSPESAAEHEVDFEGAGYYAIDAIAFSSLPLLDGVLLDRYREDVYLWELKEYES